MLRNVLIVSISFLLFASCVNKGNKTSSIKVWGNCGMCKKTIEKSIKESVASVDWNVKTKILSVSYDSTKTNIDQLQQKIAAVGYDTEKYKGDDMAYTKLHECCQYERK